MIYIRIFAICWFGAVCTTLSAQNKKFPVSGVVIDSLTGKSMVNVNISVAGATSGGTTNASGEFQLNLPRIPAVLYFSHMGYGISSLQVEKSGEKGIRVLMMPETHEITEVTISAQKIAKVIHGDTLNIMDFEPDGNRLILFASPSKNVSDLRIYLTTLSGEPLDYIQVKNSGKWFYDPVTRTPTIEYLMKDFTGQVNYLDKVSVHEIRHGFDKLYFGYETQYPDFLSWVLPVTCEMKGKLVYQGGTRAVNYIWYYRGEIIKVVHDKHWGIYSKDMMVPMFRKDNQLFIFDFYNGHIEVFDSELKSCKKISIDFQFVQVNEALVLNYQYVDVKDFTREILFDEQAGRAYAFYRIRTNGRQSLREIDLATGKIVRQIEIPDFPNISNVRVSGNAVYFLYDTKVYPYYRMLYRMLI